MPGILVIFKLWDYVLDTGFILLGSDCLTWVMSDICINFVLIFVV